MGSMSLTELFRPKTESDLVGNIKSIQRLKECIRSRRACILHGRAGIGKTSSVYALASDLGANVYELNASDQRKKENLKDFIRQLKNHCFVMTVFLLDEIDGAEDFKSIGDAIKVARNPLVLICNDLYKIPKEVTDLCESIKFYDPLISEVSEVIRRIQEKTGRCADFSRISHDIRSSINCAFFGGEHINLDDDFSSIEKAFKGNISNLDRDSYIWLLDNGSSFHRGRRLYMFYQMLAVADLLDRFEPITAIVSNIRSAKVEYPRYIRRAKILKGKGNVTEEG